MSTDCRPCRFLMVGEVRVLLVVLRLAADGKHRLPLAHLGVADETLVDDPDAQNRGQGFGRLCAESDAGSHVEMILDIRPVWRDFS